MLRITQKGLYIMMTDNLTKRRMNKKKDPSVTIRWACHTIFIA